jgi:hypothetical protein
VHPRKRILYASDKIHYSVAAGKGGNAANRGVVYNIKNWPLYAAEAGYWERDDERGDCGRWAGADGVAYIGCRE